MTLTEEDLDTLKAATTCDGMIEDLSVIQKLQQCLESVKQYLSSKSRTAKLWLLYMDYISVVKQYICAARTADWNLSLIALQNMDMIKVVRCNCKLTGKNPCGTLLCSCKQNGMNCVSLWKLHGIKLSKCTLRANK